MLTPSISRWRGQSLHSYFRSSDAFFYKRLLLGLQLLVYYLRLKQPCVQTCTRKEPCPYPAVAPAYLEAVTIRHKHVVRIVAYGSFKHSRLSTHAEDVPPYYFRRASWTFHA